jgi:ribosome-associated protein
MSRAIVVNSLVRVPERALQVRAVRASGPGGQNVNKVATKVDVRVDLDAIEGLSVPARARLATLCRHRLDADGRLMVSSQAERNQARNLEDALDRIRRLVAAALRGPGHVRPRGHRQGLASGGSSRRSAGARSSGSAPETRTEGAQRLGARPAR